jgi:hypothetical protein
MKRLSVRLISLIPALPKLGTPPQMGPPIKAPLSAGLTTVETEAFSEHPQRSLRKRKAAVLRSQPASSDSELSPLSDEEPVVVKKPAKKKRKVAAKVKVVLNEGDFAAAGPVEMTKSKRKAKAAVAEAEIVEYTQEDQMPKKRKRKPTVIEPAVYDIPDVERKEATFKGELHPQVSTSSLICHSLFSGRLGYASFSLLSFWRY